MHAIAVFFAFLLFCGFAQQVPHQYGVVSIESSSAGLDLLRRAEYHDVCCSDCSQYSTNARLQCFAQCYRECPGGNQPYSTLCCVECSQLAPENRLECYSQCQKTCRSYSGECCSVCANYTRGERVRCYQQCIQTCGSFREGVAETQGRS